MSNFLSQLTKKRKSANEAKERLQVLLIHDRVNLSPGAMDDLRNELIEVIARRLDVDHNAVKIEMANEGRSQRLLADFPLKTITGHKSR
jgi:cell division topological specificity factor